MGRRKQITSLQIVRALAFLSVFFIHSGIGMYGICGVSAFLILSGFLMVYNYMDAQIACGFRSRLAFSIRRIKKLYPLHIVTMLAMILLDPPDFLYMLSHLRSLFVFVVKIIANVFLLQAWIPSDSIYFSLNGLSWYLSVSLFTYFVFPLILKRIQTGGAPFVRRLLGAVLVLQLVGSYFFYKTELPSFLTSLLMIRDQHHYFTYIFPVFRLGDFCVGCCLGYFFCHHEAKSGPTAATALELLAVCLVVFVEHAYSLPAAAPIRYTLLFLPASVLVIWVFAVNRGVVTRALSSCGPLLYLGNISGYAYLIHRVMIQFMDTRVFERMPGGCEAVPIWLRILLTLAATLLCAWVYMKLAAAVSRLRKSRKKVPV